MTLRSLLRVLGLATLVTLIAAAPVGASQAAPPLRPSAPGGVYLSLGDSIAYGFQGPLLDEQLASGNVDPSAFHGFTDELTAKLARAHPGLQQVNLGCPGETTTSFFHACEYPFPLHVPYSSSQFGAALATIRSHRGAVGTITVTLGANDLTNLIDSCSGDTSCVTRGLPKVLATVRQNLFLTVVALHLAAPRAAIVLLKYYNPFAPFDPASTPNVLALDASIGRVAAITHARVADAYPRFNLTPPQPGTLCHLTLMCDFGDVHPSDAGYHEIANVFFAALSARNRWR